MRTTVFNMKRCVIYRVSWCPSHVTCVVLCLLTASFVSTLEPRRSRCERITIPMCLDMPYNLTRMPNFMGHMEQAEAAIQVHEFIPLVEIGCSRHLKFFLCSLYAPMCTEQVDVPIPSCQSICEEVKSRCLPVLQQFNFNWPHMLNCSRLPVPEKNGLCMEFPNITDERHGRNPFKERLDKQKDAINSFEHLNFSPVLYPPRRPTSFQFRPNLPPPPSGQRGVTEWNSGVSFCAMYNQCPDNFVYVLGQGSVNVDACCIPACGRDVFFTRRAKNFAEIWMGIWAAICFMSTLFSTCTFWIDAARFRYPERPIIFLCMCFWILSTAYLIRIFSGYELSACDRNGAGESHLAIEGLESSGCIVIFLLLYYFGMASCLWWVVITITWYLAAGKKWGHEAIESKSTYFHMTAWGIPAILTIIVLILRQVDADELTGMCYVGNQNTNALLGFVIIPECVFFILGVTFIILGFVSLVRIRKAMKTVGRNITKLEKLMLRIGIFTVLYMVPSVFVIGSNWYQYIHQNQWKATAIMAAITCQTRRDKTCSLNGNIASEEVFMLRIFMSSLLGISSGMWVWSGKTWNSWGRFCGSWWGRRSRRDFKSLAVVYQTPANGQSSSRKSAVQVTRV